jgi:succinate dehydrogenase/fumarate reductase flavoprotein subunit
VRGTGGLRVVSDDCSTSVPGLFAAGDAATRERVAGASTGGGAQNSAWALSSGQWAGRGAAYRARIQGARTDRTVEAIGGPGVRPQQIAAPAASAGDVIATMQGEMLPFDKMIFRSGQRLGASLSVLENAWANVSASSRPADIESGKSREAAALVATARWCYAAAFARNESRGMHLRDDEPGRRDEYARRLLVGGLDKVWTRFEPPGDERLGRVAS